MCRAAPARPAADESRCVLEVKGPGLQVMFTLTTKHAHFPVDFTFYSSFGFIAILRGKRRECPQTTCLPTLAPPIDAPPDAALLLTTNPQGSMVIAQSPECARGPLQGVHPWG